MNIADSAQRKLGPLPAWAWAIALGGAFLAWRMFSGGGSSSSDADITDSGDTGGSDDEDMDLIGPPGPAGPAGPAGPIGATGETGAAGAVGETGARGAAGVAGETGARGPAGRPGCPAGYKPVKTDGKWRCVRVPKPNCATGRVAKWNPNTFTWSCVKRTNSFTMDAPHIAAIQNDPRYNTYPTITLQDVPAHGIMPPSGGMDGPDIPKIRPLPDTEGPTVLSSVPPIPPQRSIGRPYHGGN